MEVELIHQPGPQCLLDEAGAAAELTMPSSPAISRARVTASTTPSTNSNPESAGGWSSTLWVRTTQGPKGDFPPHPLVVSYIRRPTTTAPAPRASSRTSASTPVAVPRSPS